MPLAAVRAPNQTSYLPQTIDQAIRQRKVNTALFIGRTVCITGGNYLHETTIADVIFTLQPFVTPGDLVLSNIRFTVKDPKVEVDKKRYKLTRIIDHLSYAYAPHHGHMVVVFEEDGHEPLKEATIELLD